MTTAQQSTLVPDGRREENLSSPLRLVTGAESTRVTLPTGTSPQIREVIGLLRQVAVYDSTVLILGESGTGKEVAARAIHELSPRRQRPFAAVNCGAIPADLLESELFGHEKGAFTGAVAARKGRFEVAEGGTLFLDEISELPLSVQPKLLRLVQDKAYERVGETRTHVADVRILSATNRDLPVEVAAGRFREDLYYRLNVIEVELPPLRRRRGDILPLAERLLRSFARQSGKPGAEFTAVAKAVLAKYDWPGNVRELRNAVERGIILSAGRQIDVVHLPTQIGAGPPARVEIGGTISLETLEAEHMRRVMAAAPSLDEAAATLGIDPSTLYRKRRRYGL
jgi:NtrC-family two-component system response regulator AlgB